MTTRANTPTISNPYDTISQLTSSGIQEVGKTVSELGTQVISEAGKTVSQIGTQVISEAGKTVSRFGIRAIKDPGSAITHFIGAVATLLAAAPLLVRAHMQGSGLYIVAAAVFLVSMFLLYGASTTYHALDISEKVNKVLRKIDHMMIFVFIAGTYTPICLIALHNTTGYLMLAGVWSIALIGMVVKFCWITCPKWFSSVLYIAMGWICIFAFAPLYTSLSRPGFLWLAAGGVLYTIGGVIYALKLPLFNARFKNFGSHEIFHLFVMAGSLCHYIVIYKYVMQIAIS